MKCGDLRAVGGGAEAEVGTGAATGIETAAGPGAASASEGGGEGEESGKAEEETIDRAEWANRSSRCAGGSGLRKPRMVRPLRLLLGVFICVESRAGPAGGLRSFACLTPCTESKSEESDLPDASCSELLAVLLSMSEAPRFL